MTKIRELKKLFMKRKIQKFERDFLSDEFVWFPNLEQQMYEIGYNYCPICKTSFEGKANYCGKEVVYIHCDVCELWVIITPDSGNCIKTTDFIDYIKKHQVSIKILESVKRG